MTKKFILTGGPGTGKSSLILALEQASYTTVRECAEDYIRFRQARGQPEPWTEEDFQDKILELQLQREERIHPEVETVFLDRGALDGLAYTEKEETVRKLEEAGKEAGYETTVFLIEYLGHTEKTGYRREGEEEAVRLGEKLQKIYEERGYRVVRVPKGPLEERLEKILAELK